MPNLLEIYDLLEWGEYSASSQFWSEAKAGRLDSTSFWSAYSSELKKLGLLDLFDTNYKELKEKGSYGRIKKAAEELRKQTGAKPRFLGCKSFIKNVGFTV